MARSVFCEVDQIETEGLDFAPWPGEAGKRVFEGTVSDDPKSAVIWEAFKPDTEPPRITRADEIEKKRAEIIALIRRGRSAVSEAKQQESAEDEAGFVEEQGGIY